MQCSILKRLRRNNRTTYNCEDVGNEKSMSKRLRTKCVHAADALYLGLGSLRYCIP